MQMRLTRVSEPVIFSLLQTFFSCFSCFASSPLGSAAAAPVAVIAIAATAMVRYFMAVLPPVLLSEEASPSIVGPGGYRSRCGLQNSLLNVLQIVAQRLSEVIQHPAQRPHLQVVPARFGQDSAQGAASGGGAAGGQEIA